MAMNTFKPALHKQTVLVVRFINEVLSKIRRKMIRFMKNTR